MTRREIKSRIKSILKEHLRVKFNSGYPLIVGYDDAIEEIINLWDKGFTYELVKED